MADTRVTPLQVAAGGVVSGMAGALALTAITAAGHDRCWPGGSRCPAWEKRVRA